MSYSSASARSARGPTTATTSTVGARSILRPTSAAVTNAGRGMPTSSSSSKAAGGGTTSALLANLNAELHRPSNATNARGGATAGVGAGQRSTSRGPAAAADRPQSARTPSSSAVGGGYQQQQRAPSSSSTAAYGSPTNTNRGGSVDRSSMSALKRELSGANALMKELGMDGGGGLGLGSRRYSSAGPSRTGALPTASTHAAPTGTSRGSVERSDAPSSPLRAPPGGGGGMAFMQMAPPNASVQRPLVNPALSASSASAAATSGSAAVPPPAMLIPSKPAMARPTASAGPGGLSASGSGAGPSSSFAGRRPSMSASASACAVASSGASSLNTSVTPSPTDGEVSASPTTTTMSAVVAAHTAAAIPPKASSSPTAAVAPTVAAVPQPKKAAAASAISTAGGASSRTAASSSAVAAAAGRSSAVAVPRTTTATPLNQQQQQHGAKMDSTDHLNFGLGNGMERRHSGKYVHHYPCAAEGERGGGGGHYVCGKCHVPLLSAKKKVPSIGGYATFADYFTHSVDLEVIVPLLGDTFEGSFVGLRCIQCKTFFGRMVDEKSAQSNAMGAESAFSYGQQYGSSPHRDGGNKKGRRGTDVSDEYGGAASDDDDDDTDGDDDEDAMAILTEGSGNAAKKKALTSPTSASTDVVQVNSCAIVYTAQPPPPGFETEEALPADPIASILSLRRRPNTNSTNAAMTSPAPLSRPGGSRIAANLRHVPRIEGSDDEGSEYTDDGSDYGSDEEDEDPEADDDLWSAMRNKNRATATAA